ncbi:MAG: hypothetical protein HFG58_13700 [Lachnospiraceae bacterium]|nr:hypothetical protein [Lachnospiraceae bacterium]MCI8838320.1 hypothetical protein [Hungatella sp.]
MNQDERIAEYTRLMQEALMKTGITYAVEAGSHLILFDTQTNEPIELEITVGTEVTKKNGQTSVVTFDRSNI